MTLVESSLLSYREMFKIILQLQVKVDSDQTLTSNKNQTLRL